MIDTAKVWCKNLLPARFHHSIRTAAHHALVTPLSPESIDPRVAYYVTLPPEMSHMDTFRDFEILYSIVHSMDFSLK